MSKEGCNFFKKIILRHKKKNLSMKVDDKRKKAVVLKRYI